MGVHEQVTSVLSPLPPASSIVITIPADPTRPMGTQASDSTALGLIKHGLDLRTFASAEPSS
jgi:hypothetical protein